jgi:protein BCP1
MTFLQQLFLKESLNVFELAEVIVDENDVGSVIKLVGDDESDNDDDGDDRDDALYGCITVLNFRKHKSKQCFKDLDLWLQNKVQTFGGSAQMLSILRDTTTNIGWVISERLVNMPQEIAHPLYKSLVKDIEKAKKTKALFDFQYYLVISKCYKRMFSQANERLVKKKRKTKCRVKQERLEADDIAYCNAEDALLSQVAEASICFPVGDGTALAGEWGHDDDELVPYRMVMLLTSSQFRSAVSKIERDF